MIAFDIGFVPDTPEEKEEALRQAIADYTDCDPTFANRINGLTWVQIYRLYDEAQ